MKNKKPTTVYFEVYEAKELSKKRTIRKRASKRSGMEE